MIPIILIGIITIIGLTIAANEYTNLRKDCKTYHESRNELLVRNCKLYKELVEANDKIVDLQIELSEERDKVKRLEETMLTNAASMSLQRYDVVPLMEHIDAHPYSNKPIFEFGKLTKHGRKVAVSAFKGMVNDICADDETFDSFVDVFTSNDESGVDVCIYIAKNS